MASVNKWLQNVIKSILQPSPLSTHDQKNIVYWNFVSRQFDSGRNDDAALSSFVSNDSKWASIHSHIYEAMPNYDSKIHTEICYFQHAKFFAVISL